MNWEELIESETKKDYFKSIKKVILSDSRNGKLIFPYPKNYFKALEFCSYEDLLIAVALFLSFFIMGPVFEVVYRDAIAPFLDGQLGIEPALVEGLARLKEFMVANTRSDTLNLFVDLSKSGPFQDEQAIPLNIILPAFITSELKTAFEIGFLIFLPFLVIDMVIASILMSLGMMMLSPMLISLPFKLLLFVLVDGWAMTIGSLSATFMV